MRDSGEAEDALNEGLQLSAETVAGAAGRAGAAGAGILVGPPLLPLPLRLPPLLPLLVLLPFLLVRGAVPAAAGPLVAAVAWDDKVTAAAAAAGEGAVWILRYRCWRCRRFSGAGARARNAGGTAQCRWVRRPAPPLQPATADLSI
jgi:hypothetical protein